MTVEAARPQSHSAARFIRHFLEMVVAMAVGMFGLGAAAYAGFQIAGLDYYETPPEPFLLIMAFNMWVGMAVWMRHRRHGWPAIVEMGGAMFAPFVGLLPLFRMDAISEDALYGLGHVLMLPAMLAVMLRRRHEYVHPTRPDQSEVEEGVTLGTSAEGDSRLPVEV